MKTLIICLLIFQFSSIALSNEKSKKEEILAKLREIKLQMEQIALERQTQQNELAKILENLTTKTPNLDAPGECVADTTAEQTLRPIDKYAATSDEVSSAACRKEIPTIASMKEQIDSRLKEINDPLISRTIMGIEFKNQPASLLSVFELLVKPSPNFNESVKIDLAGEELTEEEKLDLKEDQTFMQDYFSKWLTDQEGNQFPLRPSQKTYDLTSKVGQNCHEVYCALSDIFGKERGMKLLYLNGMFDINASELSGHHIYGTEHISAWKNEELDIILSSLVNTPHEIRPTLVNQHFSHFDRDPKLIFNNGEKVGNSTMIFYNGWDQLPSTEQKEYAFFHEYAHLISVEKGIIEGSKLFKKWEEITNASKGNSHSCPSHYAKKNSEEDLAESIAGYRYSPATLKERSPERYDFLKKHIFDGKEFMTKEDCKTWTWN